MTGAGRNEKLEASLRRLCLVVEAAKASVIVDGDGLLIASYPRGDGANGDIDAGELAALAASLSSLGQRALERLEGGKSGRLVLEGEAGALLTYPVDEVALAVLVDADANLAQALFATEKAAAEIEPLLFPA